MENNDKILLAELEKFMAKYEVKRLRTDVFTRIITLVIAALSLIAALAWDKALHQVFEAVFGHNETVASSISYAFLVTVIAAVISLVLARFLQKEEK